MITKILYQEYKEEQTTYPCVKVTYEGGQDTVVLFIKSKFWNLLYSREDKLKRILK